MNYSLQLFTHTVFNLDMRAEGNSELGIINYEKISQ